MAKFLIHYVIPILSVIGVAGVLLARHELSKLKKGNPEVLARAGIVEIDWWWRCIRGMFRLGFLQVGAGLRRRTRVIFMVVIFTYIWLIVFSIMIMSGVVGLKGGGGN